MRTSAEDGFGLIEVMVSALLVVVVGLAAFNAMQSTSRASSTSKYKGTAASLAQEDQERLKGRRTADLVAFSEPPRQVSIDGMTYTVQSEARLIEGPVTVTGCTAGRGEQQLNIVSTVRWQGMRSTERPVRIEGLLAPPLDAGTTSTGHTVLKLTRADGSPLQGQLVTLSGPGVGTQATTGPEGCAFFANQPVGTGYTFSFTRAGWVDPAGNETITIGTHVVGGDLIAKEARYDQAATIINARVVSYLNGAVRSAALEQLTLAHNSIPVGNGKRVIAPDAPAAEPNGTADVLRLFPFDSPYTIYSSSQCGKPLPASLAVAVNNAGGASELTLAPGALLNNTVYVFEPPLNPTVSYNGTTTPVAGARVFFRSTDPACPTATMQTTRAAGTFTTDGKPIPLGTIPDIGFPYGTYSICAEYAPPGGSGTRNTGWATRTNDNVTPSWTMVIPRSNGRFANEPCP